MDQEIIYNKLVRDKITDIIKESGKKYQAHVANDQEYREELYRTQ